MGHNYYGKRAKSIWSGSGSGRGRGRGWREAWAAHPLCASYVTDNPYRCSFAEALRAGRAVSGGCVSHPYRIQRQIPRDICWYNPKECL
jgi:hypothetical protein